MQNKSQINIKKSKSAPALNLINHCFVQRKKSNKFAVSKEIMNGKIKGIWITDRSNQSRDIQSESINWHSFIPKNEFKLC